MLGGYQWVKSPVAYFRLIRALVRVDNNKRNKMLFKKGEG